MSREPCDACGEAVRIGGGIGDFWTTESGTTGGMALELADGTEWFLCHDCIDDLPDDREVTGEDVAALGDDAGGE